MDTKGDKRGLNFEVVLTKKTQEQVVVPFKDKLFARS